ncbi:circumsporozoite protein-like [Watersipora subatra]|uniref:circumsporozoite protein-like n=1 Tax=Watersipora subatra TaxID=2589382 RepID=UPI00355B1C50
MKSLQGVILAMALCSASAQFFFGGAGGNFGQGGTSRGGGGFQASDGFGSFFDAAQRNDFLDNSFFNAQGNDRAGVNAFGNTAGQENVGVQNAFGDQIFAGQNFASETVGNNAGFVDVDAAQNTQGDRSLSVALIDRQAFNVGDQISASQGFQNNFGARDAGNNQFGAQNNGFNDAQAGNNFQSFGGVRADAAQDFGVNAAQGFNGANQQRVQGRDFGRQDAGANGGGFDSFNAGGFGSFQGKK